MTVATIDQPRVAPAPEALPREPSLDGRRPEPEWLFDLVGRMTLLVILLHVADHAYLTAVARAMALAGLIFTPVLRHPAYWGAIVGVLLLFYSQLWYQVDNHKYLLGYWCLAIFLARLGRYGFGFLAFNGRVLIGACFAFAAVWKMIAPEFPDGTLLHYLLLTDWRQRELAWMVGGVSPEVFEQNAAMLESLRAPTFAADGVTLQDTTALTALTPLMAAWTIFIEAAIAVALLWPREGVMRVVGHVLLIGFVVTTYPFARVEAFALLLATMAVAHTGGERRLLTAAYLLVFITVPLVMFPYGDLAGRLFGQFLP